MVTEWCDCKDETTSGHLGLTPVAEVWVHGKCLRPSYAWWKAFETHCLECGRSFSGVVSEVCSSCGGYSWLDLAIEWQAYIRRRDGVPWPYGATDSAQEAVETSVEPIDNLRLFVV